MSDTETTYSFSEFRGLMKQNYGRAKRAWDEGRVKPSQEERDRLGMDDPEPDNVGTRLREAALRKTEGLTEKRPLDDHLKRIENPEERERVRQSIERIHAQKAEREQAVAQGRDDAAMRRLEAGTTARTGKSKALRDTLASWSQTQRMTGAEFRKFAAADAAAARRWAERGGVIDLENLGA